MALNLWKGSKKSKVTLELSKIQITSFYATKPDNQHTLLNLFAKRALQLLNIKEKEDVVIRIIKRVAKVHKARPQDINFDNPETLLWIQECTDSLKQGLNDLETIRVQPAGAALARALPARDHAQEEEALEYEERKLLELKNASHPGIHAEIKIHALENGGKILEVIDANTLELPRCKEVLNHLKTAYRGLSDDLDLWARCRNKHRLTHENLSWEHVPPERHVTGLHLELISRSSSKPYIITLVPEGNRDVPMVLEVPDCKPRCPTVGKHLSDHWYNRRVTQAIRIRDNLDIRAFSCGNAAIFEGYTNHLIVCLDRPRRNYYAAAIPSILTLYLVGYLVYSRTS